MQIVMKMYRYPSTQRMTFIGCYLLLTIVGNKLC